MTHWKITAILATVCILLAMPFYVWKTNRSSDAQVQAPGVSDTGFVGSESCRDCHKPQYDRWALSHHRMAMAVAADDSVLGNFNDATFTYFGFSSRFYRRDGKFFVHTLGPKGTPGDYQITHTFGWYPLQQYLVPFPGGRLQCLPIAWDDRQKRWYSLNPDKAVDPADWLYWTNAGQNWNGMCAECHSTDLKKNYDPAADTYHTTWSEISVGCEACHGPGAGHVQWARMPDMARPPTPDYELSVKTGNMSARQQIELCAPCHSRRMSLGDNSHEEIDYLDYAVPQLLQPGLYFPDGQILDEVYVYGSFSQSKMFHRDVRCADCHDVHSLERVAQGNQLCLQCHKAAVYDTREHHFHKQKGEKGDPIRSGDGQVLFEVGTGALCEQCHMPGRHYMGVDYRPDHSFRIPRPDLSADLETPNACNRCHIDKTDQWSQQHLTKWYGTKHRPHYGTVLSAGRRVLPGAEPDLMRLAADRLYPAIVRATALSLLRGYPGPEVTQAIVDALEDEEALLRHSAAAQLDRLPTPEQRVERLMPLLYDPVKAVRIEAARALAAVPADRLNPEQRAKLDSVLAEYKTAMGYTADFAASRHNLGNLYSHLGQPNAAEEHYLAAIRIDDQFFPAKVNLAMLYNNQGKKEAAERLLREVIRRDQEMYEIQYSLGLLLAERKKFDEAALYLAMAARGMPDRARVHYNLGLMMDYLKKDFEAETALTRALQIDPDNMAFLDALAQYHLKRGRYAQARSFARRLVEKYPSHAGGARMLRLIEARLRAKP